MKALELRKKQQQAQQAKKDKAAEEAAGEVAAPAVPELGEDEYTFVVDGVFGLAVADVGLLSALVPSDGVLPGEAAVVAPVVAGLGMTIVEPP